MTDHGLTGACRCGAVTYRLNSESMPPIYCCHCLDCQKWSGSAFSEQAVIQEGAIATVGRVTETSVTSRQGKVSLQYVCADCHTRIYSTNPKRPGVALLRAGTLDCAQSIKPRAHIWVKRKQPWVNFSGDVPSFEETPPPDELREALKQ